MKTTPEIIEDISYDQMVYNLHQVQHILNGLISGKKYDGSKLDQDKLINYKLSIVKILDLNKT
jgi:hypothetical protein|tara:strand:- start:361 stop:549 length:189 start_codon:yes stop_codon:yes gene_type:complete